MNTNQRPLKALGDIPVTAVSGSTALSTLVATGTKRVTLQARGGALHIRTDNTTAAAGTSALTLADGATWDCFCEDLTKVKIIGTNVSGICYG